MYKRQVQHFFIVKEKNYLCNRIQQAEPTILCHVNSTFIYPHNFMCNPVNKQRLQSAENELLPTDRNTKRTGRKDVYKRQRHRWPVRHKCFQVICGAVRRRLMNR